MAEQFGLVECSLCCRAFKMYDKKEAGKIYGVDPVKLKNGNWKVNFVDYDKSPIDKHICTQCISDVLNKFQY